MARCASPPPTAPGACGGCAILVRPPLALDRLRERDPEHLVYDQPKRGPGGSGPLLLTPRALLDRLAALVPPPHVHRHRYFGALAPNAPLRPAVTALAPGATTAPPPAIAEPAADPQLPYAPQFAFDQRLSW